MSETWVSREELAEAIGDDGADLLCRAVGGVSTYIPRKPVAGSRFPPSSGRSAWKGSAQPSGDSG